MRLCTRIGESGSREVMIMMTNTETSISYRSAKRKRIVRRVKNAWKKEVSRRRVSRQTLAVCLRDWRKGDHELIVDKDIIVEDW
jgi:hypothetical protein